MFQAHFNFNFVNARSKILLSTWRFDSIKDKSSSSYAIRLKSTHQYINEKNRTDLLTVNDQIRFHEVEICFNLVWEFVSNLISIRLNKMHK